MSKPECGCVHATSKRIKELDTELNIASNEIHRLGMKCSNQEDTIIALQAEVDHWTQRWIDEEAENAKLREALKMIVNRQGHWTPDQTIARKALEDKDGNV